MIVRLVAVSLALVLGLSACSSSDEDPPASDRPEFAQEPGQEGAERFAGYWVETLNRATDSGDTETLRTLASPECTSCEDFAQQLDTIYEDGGRVESDGWEITTIVPEAGATEDAVWHADDRQRLRAEGVRVCRGEGRHIRGWDAGVPAHARPQGQRLVRRRSEPPLTRLSTA